MPIQAPGPGIPGPTMPSSIYPTSNLRWGDPVTVTGPFAGQFQGNVRVKFAGAPWQAPAILGPFQATVQVPDGAQTGACVVEINGRVAFGTQCSVVPGGALRGRLSERQDTRSWKDFGPKDLNGMGYIVLGAVTVGELPADIQKKITAIETDIAKWQRALKDPIAMATPGVKVNLEQKIASALAEIKRLRQAPAKARSETARKEQRQRRGDAAATTEPGAPVSEAKTFPVLLVAGIGAAAVLGYVLWKRRRAS